MGRRQKARNNRPSTNPERHETSSCSDKTHEPSTNLERVTRHGATDAERKDKAECQTTSPELVTAEQRATDAEIKATAAEHRATEAEKKAIDAEHRATEAEMRRTAAEHATTQAQNHSYKMTQKMLQQQTLRLAAEKHASECDSKIAILLADKKDLIDRHDVARDHCQKLLTDIEREASAAEDRAHTAETALNSWQSALEMAEVWPAAGYRVLS